MQTVTQLSRGALLLLAILASTACGGNYLRGSVEPSPDGKTYLVVAEGNNCSQITIDGAVWPHAIGQLGAVTPGKHIIDCNGEIGFSIPAGKIFKFNYWGP